VLFFGFVLEGFYDNDEGDDPTAATKPCFYEESKASNSRKHAVAKKSRRKTCEPWKGSHHGLTMGTTTVHGAHHSHGAGASGVNFPHFSQAAFCCTILDCAIWHNSTVLGLFGLHCKLL